MKKSKIILIIFLIAVLCVFAWYKLTERKESNTYIATVEKIDGSTLYINEITGKTSNARINHCWISTKGVEILDEKNNKIDVSNIDLGDTLIVVANPKIIVYTNPAHIDNIKYIKVVYKSISN